VSDFSPKTNSPVFQLIYRKFGNRLHSKDDLLSGLTVALALVPEAVAFAIIAGVSPIIGLYAAFMICLITAVLGGRPGMISGATGALAVIMVSLVLLGNEKGEALGLGSDLGVQYLFAAIILMGIIQIGCGCLKLGRFVRLIPQPVMFGFVNGLAIVIFEAQFPMFTESPTTPGSPWLMGNDLYMMAGLIALTMAIIFLLPKLTTQFPSSLAAIGTVSLIVIGLDLDTLVVRDMASIGGELPSLVNFSIPFTWDTLVFIAPFSFILAAVGLIESLMTLTLIDELTETRGNSTRECLGQGIANVVTGFLGGMGGCAMIGQSIINILIVFFCEFYLTCLNLFRKFIWTFNGNPLPNSLFFSFWSSIALTLISPLPATLLILRTFFQRHTYILIKKRNFTLLIYTDII